MPKLPDKNALGNPDYRSARGVISASQATPDLSGIGASGRNPMLDVVGKGMKQLGAVVEDRANRNTDLGLLKADAYLDRNLADLDTALEKDPDHGSYGEKFDVSAGHIVKQAGELIDDPNVRERFNIRAGEKAYNYRGRVMGRGDNLKNQEDFASLEDVMKTYRSRYSDPNTSDDDRKKYLESIEQAIQVGERNMLVNPANAATMRDKYIKGSVIEDAEVQARHDPEALREGIVGPGFEKALIQSESSGKAGLVNSIGYAGLYQFGAPRLVDLGLYTRGSGEKVSGKWRGDKWSGEFSIPGFGDVKTLADFLGNPEAQRAAFALHAKKIDDEIVGAGLDQYEGQTVGGVLITRDGLRAMLHLGGLGSAKKALRSGGANDPEDAYGTSVLAYARKFGASDRFATLTPLEKEEYLAKAGQRSASRLEGTREGLKRMMKDDVSSIEETGVGREGLDFELAAKVLEPNQIERYVLDRRRAEMQYEATKDLGQLSNDAINQRLDQISPQAGAAGYDDQSYVYRKALSSASRILKQRETDPALAADQSEHVQRLYASMEVEPIDGVKIGRPTVDQLVEARLKAQEDFGIAEGLRKVVTQDEASGIMKALKGKDERAITDGINDTSPHGPWIDTVNEVEAAWGPYAKQALADSIEYAIKSKEKAEVMAGLILNVQRDGRLTERDLRPLSEIQRIEDDSPFPSQYGTRSVDALALEPRGRSWREATSSGFAGQDVSATQLPNNAQVKRLQDAFDGDPSTPLIGKFDEKFGDGAAALALGIVKGKQN